MTARPGRAGRRQALAAVGRVLISVTLMVVVYYWAPLDLHVDTAVLIWLGGGLLGLGLALVWQVRAILVSDTPRLRAAEAMGVGLPFLLLLYASVYSVLALDVPASFTQSLSRTDALYFTMTVFSTVGFGDITPVTELARILTMTQMVVGLVVVGVVAKLLFGAVDLAIGRQSSSAADPTAQPAPER